LLLPGSGRTSEEGKENDTIETNDDRERTISFCLSVFLLLSLFVFHFLSLIAKQVQRAAVCLMMTTGGKRMLMLQERNRRVIPDVSEYK
jgi:hypothetical protein